MTERKNVTNGHKQKSLKSLVGTFQRFLFIHRNSDICIYNILVRVCFSWIVFPIMSNDTMLEIGAHSTPSKRFEPRHIFVGVMFILFCCISFLLFLNRVQR